MKSYLDLKRQPLPYYVSAGLLKTIRLSAKAHGYRCALWFGIIRLKDHVLNIWAQSIPWNRVRIRLQRWRGVRIGKNVHIGTGVVLDFPYPYFVIVEDGSSLAGNDNVLAHSTPLEYHRNCVESFVAPVIIHKHVWVSINVTILPGVEIGEGAIIAAGSVVNHAVPPMTLVGGVPAKVIKDLAPELHANYSEDYYQALLLERQIRYGFPSTNSPSEES